MTIRTILVDDEKLAIQGLMLRLQAFPDVEIIDTCSNGREAIRKIKRYMEDEENLSKASSKIVKQRHAEEETEEVMEESGND